MNNDRDVENLVGKDFVSKILDHASEGMEENDLKQIARQLGEMSDGPNIVLGNHKRRINSTAKQSLLHTRVLPLSLAKITQHFM